MNCCAARGIPFCSIRSLMTLLAVSLLLLPKLVGAQVHEHSTLLHNVPDFRGQSGCETVTASRDYSSTTTVECLVIESGTTRVRAGATVTVDTILVLSSGGFRWSLARI